MAGEAHDPANWILAFLTTLVWGSTYALYFLRDPRGRRRLDLLLWRARNRLRFGKRGPQPVPSRLLRPPVPAAATPRPLRMNPAIAGSRTATAVAVAEPAMRIAEWRADNLPLRYRLLGRVRRGANDN